MHSPLLCFGWEELNPVVRREEKEEVQRQVGLWFPVVYSGGQGRAGGENSCFPQTPLGWKGEAAPPSPEPYREKGGSGRRPKMLGQGVLLSCHTPPSLIDPQIDLPPLTKEVIRAGTS